VLPKMQFFSSVYATDSVQRLAWSGSAVRRGDSTGAGPLAVLWIQGHCILHPLSSFLAAGLLAVLIDLKCLQRSEKCPKSESFKIGSPPSKEGRKGCGGAGF
jgi:hypothetical protein